MRHTSLSSPAIASIGIVLTLALTACGDAGQPPYIGAGSVVAPGALDAGIPAASGDRFEGLGSTELTTGVDIDDEPLGICAEGRPPGFERCEGGLDEDCDGLVDEQDDDCGEPDEEVVEELCAGREGVTNLDLLPLDSCVDAMLAARANCHAMPGCTLISNVSDFGHGIAGTDACYGNGNFGARLWTCSSEIPDGFRAL